MKQQAGVGALAQLTNLIASDNKLVTMQSYYMHEFRSRSACMFLIAGWNRFARFGMPCGCRKSKLKPQLTVTVEWCEWMRWFLTQAHRPPF
jgi:hypothetical protein